MSNTRGEDKQDRNQTTFILKGTPKTNKTVVG